MREIILTIDFESDWETGDIQAIESVLPRLLNFLHKKKAKATFFVVAGIAERCSAQIKQILRRGHEVASHSLTHRELNKMTFDEVEKEVSESKRILEGLGAKVLGFRAPKGIALPELPEILKKHKYIYDSSIIASWFPKRYSELKNSKPKKLENSIIEIPIPNFSKFKVPAGLSYNRLFYPLLKNSFALEPYLVYLHLHEFIKKKQAKHIPAHVKLLSLRNRGERAWEIFKEFVELSSAKFITCRDFIKLNSKSFS